MLSEKGLEVKKQFEELNQLKRRIKNLKIQLEEILELAALPQKADYKPMISKGGDNTAPQEKYLLRVEELEEKIKLIIEEACDREDRLIDAMKSLDSLSYNIITERYLHGKPLRRIAYEFNYSDRQMRRYYATAFEKISNKGKD